MISQIWEAIRAEQMKIDRTVSARNCSPLNTLQRCIDYVDIIGASSAMCLQSEYMGENGDFQSFYVLHCVSKKPDIVKIAIFSKLVIAHR